MSLESLVFPRSNNERTCPKSLTRERRSDLEIEFVNLITGFYFDASKQETSVMADLASVWNEVDRRLCCGDRLLGL